MSLRALEPAATLFHCHRRPAVCFLYFLFACSEVHCFHISTEFQEVEAVWLHHDESRPRKKKRSFSLTDGKMSERDRREVLQVWRISHLSICL